MNDFFGKTEKFFPANEVKQPVFNDFVAFDIETTGLARDSHIIEIGAVKVSGGNIVEFFSEFVNPGIPIPYQITSITGITNEMVANADSEENVLRRFSAFAGNSILVGHNAISFDCRIMGHWADMHQVFIGNDVFDTLRYAKYRSKPMPGLGCNKLAVLCEYFGITSDTYHRATDDAFVTAQLYLCLKNYNKS